MPEVMRVIAGFSPLNWAHVGFIDLFLREASTLDVLPQLLKLFVFFAACLTIGVLYRKTHSPLNN
jgi:ABC-2 type transport system permease protein